MFLWTQISHSTKGERPPVVTCQRHGQTSCQDNREGILHGGWKKTTERRWLLSWTWRKKVVRWRKRRLSKAGEAPRAKAWRWERPCVCFQCKWWYLHLSRGPHQKPGCYLPLSCNSPQITVFTFLHGIASVHTSLSMAPSLPYLKPESFSKLCPLMYLAFNPSFLLRNIVQWDKEGLLLKPWNI